MTLSVTACYVIFGLAYLGFQIGLWTIFNKAGLAGWKSVVPVYRTWIWLRKVIERPAWWMILMFVPFINIFMGYLMIWKTIRLFGKTSYLSLVPGTFFNCIYLPYLGFSKKETFTPRAQLKKFEKSSAREWGDAIIFAVAAAYLFRSFLFELYAIPTSSMESSLMVGDYLAVSKFHFGGRIPQTVFTIPFMHHTVALTKDTPNYLSWLQLPYMRFPATSPVKNNDPIVFNYPDGDTVAIERQNESYYEIVRQYEAILNPDATFYEKNMISHRYSPEEIMRIKSTYGTTPYHVGAGREAVAQEYTIRVRPVDKRENYVKRCVALPGDKLEIINGQLYINGKAAQNPERMQFCYTVTPPLSPKFVKKLRLNEEDMYPEYGVYTLNNEQRKQIEKAGHTVTPTIETPGFDYAIFPHDPRFSWNKDNFGPLVMPKAGTTVELNDSTIVLYDKIIRNYELNTLEQRDGKIFINGKEAKSYTFQQNYYFMMGDNRHNSADSRYWGFVPEDHIVGKPVLVWLSLDKYREWGDGKIRWSRMFRHIK